jgi:transcriptional regulator with XRE-family HTH domain
MVLKYTDAYIDGIIALEDLISGQLLRRKRKQAEITLEQLSEACGVSKSHLAALETIGKRPGEKGSAKTVQRITLMRILDAMSVDYLTFKTEVDTLVKEEYPKLELLRKKKKSLSSLEVNHRDYALLNKEIDMKLQQGRITEGEALSLLGKIQRVFFHVKKSATRELKTLRDDVTDEYVEQHVKNLDEVSDLPPGLTPEA